ncbi:hypothetical protein C8A05DRAFT_12265 [Staphylotrichum tortipilum]|uniref:DUF1996 domain-containing protein n=1 Tax=Staphylotrichum tortipilum TaxID=2831512 RepID=A0AAN6RX27_9PEZI|nr:hypothetical protein C8A05DRAFT_12265 [Staphylotrichum longicolle]
MSCSLLTLDRCRPQLILEVCCGTGEFNKEGLWPEDGSRPFVWSFGDGVGYGAQGDYVFGWRGDSLLDRAVVRRWQYAVYPTLPTQTIEAANECVIEPSVKEEVDGWLEAMPGCVVVDVSRG